MADIEKLPAFVLAPAPDFWWTVRIPVPRDDDYDYAALRVKFAWSSQDELDKMRGAGLAEGETAPTDDEIARAKVRGFELNNERGEAVAFSEVALAELLQAPMVRSAIVATYMAAMSGMAARKNARTPLATG
jgi:hypothetical protein